MIVIDDQERACPQARQVSGDYYLARADAAQIFDILDQLIFNQNDMVTVSHEVALGNTACVMELGPPTRVDV